MRSLTPSFPSLQHQNFNDSALIAFGFGIWVSWDEGVGQEIGLFEQGKKRWVQNMEGRVPFLEGWEVGPPNASRLVQKIVIHQVGRHRGMHACMYFALQSYVRECVERPTGEGII